MLSPLGTLKPDPGSLATRHGIAFDRMSLRSVDPDGRLRVAKCNISKATVNPYLGREIPGAESYGLDPDRIYYLYRDPEELKRAAPTFFNLPLTLRHIVVTAEEPAQDMVVGSIGSDVAFEDPYLTASLAIWTAEAKALVESGILEQISCAYRYRADMTPGVSPDGVAYDGVMRDIIGNHVALVEQGRAGPDVVVADSLPLELAPVKSKFLAALIAALAPTITFKPEQVVALDAALDADMDDEATDAEMKAACDAMSDEEKKAACDAYADELKKASDALTDEEKDEAYKRAAKDKRAKDSTPPTAPEGGAPKPAQDGKLFTQADLDAAIATARTEGAAQAKTSLVALHTALEAVKPIVGDVACDSADEAYKLAFKQLNVEIDGVHASAYPKLFALAAKAGKPTVATDGAMADANAVRGAMASINIKVS